MSKIVRIDVESALARNYSQRPTRRFLDADPWLLLLSWALNSKVAIRMEHICDSPSVCVTPQTTTPAKKFCTCSAIEMINMPFFLL